MNRLELKDVSTHYGTSHILFDVSLAVDEGEVVCLLGRNGAGKTTTIKTIMGLARASSGGIEFAGENLIGLQPHEIACLGVGYVPDERLIFPDLTVRENLEVATKKGVAPAPKNGRWSASTRCSPPWRPWTATWAVTSAVANNKC
jgi:branched-chain amino acid transport system ATP-binding protein